MEIFRPVRDGAQFYSALFSACPATTRLHVDVPSFHHHLRILAAYTTVLRAPCGGARHIFPIIECVTAGLSTHLVGYGAVADFQLKEK